jgi:hypothetical protein
LNAITNALPFYFDKVSDDEGKKKFEHFVTAVLPKIHAFRNVMQCHWASVSPRFAKL